MCWIPSVEHERFGWLSLFDGEDVVQLETLASQNFLKFWISFLVSLALSCRTDSKSSWFVLSSSSPLCTHHKEKYSPPVSRIVESCLKISSLPGLSYSHVSHNWVYSLTAVTKDGCSIRTQFGLQNSLLKGNWVETNYALSDKIYSVWILA